MQIVSGDVQAGTVGTELAQPLVVKVLDAAGTPVSGQLVNFRVTAGGGSVFAGAAITSSSGVARERWTLGTVAGAEQTVEVRAVDSESGAALTFATFHATANAGAATTMTIVSGDLQSAAAGSSLSDSLLVRVADRYDNPVQGLTVTWAVPSGAGTIAAATSTTSATGHASAKWTVGNTVGSYQVRASLPTNASPAVAPVDFRATVVAAAPAAIVLDSGLVATTAAGTRLQIVARVTDGFGNGVAWALVTFTQADGVRGVDTQPTSPYTTDATGRVRVSWGVGTVAGAQAIRAWTGALSSSIGTVQVEAAAPTVIAKVAGDAQTTNPGTAVPIAPSVKITDQYNNPVARASVAFAVATGGGSVTSATTATSADGIATVGSWTLGTTSGTNTLTAAVNGISTTFTATARTQSPDVRVTITNPASNALVSDTLNVSATVSSTYQVASVRVTAAGRQADLALVSGAWTGSLSLAGVPRDTLSVTVRATDINGAATEAIVVINHDRAPTLTLATSLRYAVARPTIDLGATCTDDDPAGCRSVVATLSCTNYRFGCPFSQGTVVASGTTSLGTISLAAYEGQRVDMDITATDSRGQTVSYLAAVFVEASARLVEAARVPGRAWDYRGGRTLYSEVATAADQCGDRHNYAGTALRDASGSLQTIPFPRPVFPRKAVLTVTGAIASDATSTNHVMEWRNDAVSETPLTSHGAFDANDEFAAFASGGATNSTAPLYRRNLGTGLDELVSSSVFVAGDSPGTICNAMISDVGREPPFRVAPNGDVVYAPSTGGLYRFRDGSSTLVSTSGSRPRTDGINVVFQRVVSTSTTTYETVVWDGATEATLASGEPAASYAVLGGWTAFVKSDVNGALQAWTRSPSGTLQKLTAFGAGFVVEVVGPDGSVIGTASGRRYAVSPAGAATDIGSSQGTVLTYRDGGFFVLLGQLVLRITP